MDRDHSGDRLLQPPMERPTRFSIQGTFSFQEFLKLQWVHVVGTLIDIDECWTCASLGNCLCRRDERVRHSDRHFTGLNASRHKRKAQRVGSAANPNAMARIAET